MEQINQSETRRYNRLLAEIDEVYHEIAVRQGYSDSMMSILYVLADNGGQCLLAELVKLACVYKQTANSALRRLEREGLVYLEPAGGRTKRVCLTEAGFSAVHETVERVIAVEKKIYASWSKEEWTLYVQLTERYLRQLREEMKEL